MKAVTEANPYIDQFHYFDKDINATIEELKKFDFDYVIDLHKNFRTFRIKKALGVPSLTYQKLHAITKQMEIETYTWGVLPQEFQAPIEESIAREVNWVLKQMQ